MEKSITLEKKEWTDCHIIIQNTSQSMEDLVTDTFVDNLLVYKARRQLSVPYRALIIPATTVAERLYFALLGKRNIDF
eukprot:scaffold7971_cov98-Skeletonema_menzelii.AAC.3